MSVFRWLFKSKKSMAKENTKPVRVGRYTISTHAQHRVSQNDRKVSKLDMLRNLFGKSIKSKVYKHDDGSNQYDQLNQYNRTITHIVDDIHVVKSIRRYKKKREQKEIKKVKER